MNDNLRSLIKIYSPGNTDWLGDEKNKKNPFTFHHIKKRSLGGTDTIDNGAILTQKSHEWLHRLENVLPLFYEKLNVLFKELNDSYMPPDNEYWKKLTKILRDINEELLNQKISGNYSYEDDNITICVKHRIKKSKVDKKA